MEAFDLDVRRHVYFSVVAHGRPPTVPEAASALGRSEADVAGAYARLHDAHALVLFPGTSDVWMANPFCFAPTPHRVEAGGRTWTGTCAWDALGIPAALHADACIEAQIGDGESIRFAIEAGRVKGWDGVVHFPLPFRRWYDDLIET